MAGEKLDDARRERLEHVAREVVRASAAGETEADEAAGSPFLYARVRARIEEERRRREEGEGWLALFGVAWRAVPAMALVAVMALALFLSSGAAELAPGFGLGAETLLGEREGDFEQVVLADTRTPANEDEVLSTIIGEGEGSR
jgi:anti-sigma-K factor RskA